MFWRLVWGTYRALKRVWYALDVEHKGTYSLERLQTLHHFLEQQKPAKASSILNLLVAFATPLPCLVIALASDALPLNPPEDGPRANGVFWIRSWLIVFSFTVAVLIPFHHPNITSIPEHRAWLLVMSAVIAIVHTACHFGLALAIGFPVPFSYVTLMLLWCSLILIGLWLYMGPACRSSPVIQQQLKRHGIFAYAVASLAVVYPLFYYAFLSSKGYAHLQFLLTCALPIIKMMEKLLLYRVSCHASDAQPAFIAFAVELFNALFVSSCMRNATSVSSTIALMVADFFGASFDLYGLRNMMLHIDSLSSKLGKQGTRAHMLDTAVLVTRHHPDALTSGCSDEADEISLGSTDAAEASPCFKIPRLPSNVAWSKQAWKQSSIVPAEMAIPAGLNRAAGGEVCDEMQRMRQLSPHDRRQFVQETCRILRRVEFLLLVEYTEVVVPLVYGKSLYAIVFEFRVNLHCCCASHLHCDSAPASEPQVYPVSERNVRRGPLHDHSKHFDLRRTATAFFRAVAACAQSAIPARTWRYPTVRSDFRMAGHSGPVGALDYLRAAVIHPALWYVIWGYIVRCQHPKHIDGFSMVQERTTHSSLNGCTRDDLTYDEGQIQAAEWVFL
jgi:hypothetical protein